MPGVDESQYMEKNPLLDELTFIESDDPFEHIVITRLPGKSEPFTITYEGE